MYIPAHYRNNDLDEVLSFIRKNAFAILVSRGTSQPEASHIPLEVEVAEDKRIFLHGHISRANPQWKNFKEDEAVLAIFNGPHAYVSSQWYNHANVPTWNYIAVHVTGRLKIISEDKLYQSLKKLVDHYEEGSSNPVAMERMPSDMIDKYLKGIVGFTIEAEKIEGKWKLSQNRNEEDYRNIIRELEQINDVNAKLVAEEMKRRN